MPTAQSFSMPQARCSPVNAVHLQQPLLDEARAQRVMLFT